MNDEWDLRYEGRRDFVTKTKDEGTSSRRTNNLRYENEERITFGTKDEGRRDFVTKDENEISSYENEGRRTKMKNFLLLLLLYGKKIVYSWYGFATVSHIGGVGLQ